MNSYGSVQQAGGLLKCSVGVPWSRRAHSSLRCVCVCVAGRGGVEVWRQRGIGASVMSGKQGLHFVVRVGAGGARTPLLCRWWCVVGTYSGGADHDRRVVKSA